MFDISSNACCTWIGPQDCMYKHQDKRTYMCRQTDRHSGWISKIVAAHTLAHIVSTRTPLRCVRLSCGGHMHAHVHACMRAYLFPFLLVKTLSYLCFTHVHERICLGALAPHTIIHTRIRTVCMCVYIYTCFFAFLSILDSWLPNSLFLLDTVHFI
jgi:hypothetical protein